MDGVTCGYIAFEAEADPDRAHDLPL